jgi:hypothetical protein
MTERAAIMLLADGIVILQSLVDYIETDKCPSGAILGIDPPIAIIDGCLVTLDGVVPLFAEAV